MVMMSRHNDSSHRKQSVFPPYVTLYDKLNSRNSAAANSRRHRSYGSTVHAIRQWFLTGDGAPLQGGRPEGEQEGRNSPGAELLRGAPKSRNNVTSTFFNSKFSLERPQIRTLGRQSFFLPRASSDLVTPLMVSINFQGGASPYAPCNMESMINKFTNIMHLFLQLT